VLYYSALICVALGILLIVIHDIIPFIDSRFGSSITKWQEFIRSYSRLLAYVLFTAAFLLSAARFSISELRGL